jgi:Ni/Co efflux regulator RcnB
MKNQNLTKGIVCAVVAALFTINVQASPVTLKADTAKMAKKKMEKKMDKKMDSKMDNKMDKKMDSKMDKKMKMKKDSAAKM